MPSSLRPDRAPDPACERDAERLLAAVQELSYLRDVDGVMAVVRRAARDLSGADGVTFVLRDGERVFYADEDAIGPLWKGRRFPMETCISGWVIRHRVPAVIEDVFVDPRIPHDVYRATFVKSLAMIPIRAEDPIGAIGAYWATSHLATDRELRLLQALAGSASVALANAELYRAARAAQAAAEAANRARDDFLAIVSHELQTPLTSILGWARALRARPFDAEATARGLEVIERNARAQASVVDDLLDASHIVGRGLDVELSPVDLGPIVDRVVHAMLPAAEAKQIALSCARALNPLVIAGDAARLAQILSSLVGNAVKFTQQGGRVEVGCARVDGRAVVRVTDTGCGILPDYLPRVFDRFSQQDTSAKRPHRGLGLGLAIARHLVDKHRGEIVVESEGEGRGATLTVSFALAALGIAGAVA
jgi:two-component system CheB/CheR fusion protein